MEWFGTGGKYTDAYSKTNLFFGGIQEPKIKYYLNLWETEGITSWCEIEDKDTLLKALVKKLEDKMKNPVRKKDAIIIEKQIELAPKIINGGFDLQKEDDIDIFNRCLEDLESLSDVNYQDEWRTMLKGENR
jgi:hypothetical protein